MNSHSVIRSDRIPVHHVPERLEIIRALVLIFQIIRVFPDVAADDRLAFAAGDGLAHERIVLVRGGNDFQFAVVGDEPDPAAAETAEARRFKLRLEIIEAAERGLDVVREFAGGRAAGVRAENFPEERMVRSGRRRCCAPGRGCFPGTDGEVLDDQVEMDLASSAALPAMALLRLST